MITLLYELMNLNLVLIFYFFSKHVLKFLYSSHFQHMISSTTYVCGELSDFTIRKVVVDDYVVNNPNGYNTKEKETTRSRIMMELLEKKQVTSPMTPPAQTRRETSLVYHYPEQHALKNQMSSEVVQKTLQILGTAPVYPQPQIDIQFPFFYSNRTDWFLVLI